MTRISWRSTGSPGAGRLVATVRSGASALDDPDPDVTSRRIVRLLTVAIAPFADADPEVFGGETPDEEQAAELATLLRDQGATAATPVGLVGSGVAGWRAVEVAAILQSAVDRLVLVGVPTPVSPLERDDAAAQLGTVTAKTLILAGQRDPDAAAGAAGWLKQARGHARVEMIPGEGQLTVRAAWERALSHAAPGTLR